MNTIQDMREQVKKNGMASQLTGQPRQQAQGGTDMTQKVADAIRKGRQDLEEKRETLRQGGELEYKTVYRPEEDKAGTQTAEQKEPGDGLQNMIRQAQMQTQQLTAQKGLLGGDADLAGAGLKLKQAAMLQGTAGIPQTQAGEQEDTGWTDTSYTTFRPTTGETRTGRYVDPRAGELVEKGGTAWMVGRDGELTDVQQKTQAEIAQMQQQARDNRYQVTGRVYGLNPDGSTPQWLSVGDQVVTGGGTYIITGHRPEGGYYSELYDPKQTTGSFSGQYNTGTYGSIIGERNGFQDSFRGNRESNGAYTGYGG